MFSVYNIYRQSRAFYSYVSRFYSQHSKLGILDYLKTNDNLVLCFASSLVMSSVSGCSVSFMLSFLKNATKALCLSVSSETAYILHMVSVSGCSVSFTAQSSVDILACSVVYLSCHYLLSFGNFWKVLEAAELFTSTATKVHRVDHGMTNAFALW